MREHASYLRGSRVYTRKGEYKTWPGYLCRVIGGVTSFHEAIRFLLNYSNFEPVVGMSSFNIDHQQLFFTFCRFVISLDFFETVSHSFSRLFDCLSDYFKNFIKWHICIYMYLYPDFVLKILYFLYFLLIFWIINLYKKNIWIWSIVHYDAKFTIFFLW